MIVYPGNFKENRSKSIEIFKESIKKKMKMVQARIDTNLRSTPDKFKKKKEKSLFEHIKNEESSTRLDTEFEVNNNSNINFEKSQDITISVCHNEDLSESAIQIDPCSKSEVIQRSALDNIFEGASQTEE